MQGTAYLQQFSPLKRQKVSEIKKQVEYTDPILLEIADVLKKLENIRLRFDYETEYDMIDSCIYEERALLARYRHLICAAKEKGITCTPTMHYRVHTENT